MRQVLGAAFSTNQPSCVGVSMGVPVVRDHRSRYLVSIPSPQLKKKLQSFILTSCQVEFFFLFPHFFQRLPDFPFILPQRVPLAAWLTAWLGFHISRKLASSFHIDKNDFLLP